MTIEAEIAALRTEVAATRTILEHMQAPALAVTKKEAARLCGVSYDTLKPFFDDNTIKTVPYGTAHRVPVSELVKFMNARLAA